MKHWFAALIGYATCRFCGRAGRPLRFVGGACDSCARENLKWVSDIGGVLTVPRDVRLHISETTSPRDMRGRKANAAAASEGFRMLCPVKFIEPPAAHRCSAAVGCESGVLK